MHFPGLWTLLTPVSLPGIFPSVPCVPCRFQNPAFQEGCPECLQQILTTGVSTTPTLQQNHFSSAWTINASGRFSRPLRLSFLQVSRHFQRRWLPHLRAHVILSGRRALKIISFCIKLFFFHSCGNFSFSGHSDSTHFLHCLADPSTSRSMPRNSSIRAIACDRTGEQIGTVSLRQVR